MNSVLNDELAIALNDYLVARRSGRGLQEALATVVEAMGRQTASSISEAASVIGTAANLWQWQRKTSWWRRLLPVEQSDRYLLANEPDVALLFIFHRNGFIRQAALERIRGPIPNTFLVAALAWRLNDWVPQVRKSALACAARCLPKTDAKPLADFFFETVHPRTTWRRWNARGKAVLEEAITRDDVKEEIVAKLLDGRKGPLPSFLSYLLRYDWIDPYLPTIASNSKVPGVRAIALRSLIRGNARYKDGTVLRWIDKPMGLRRREPKIIARSLSIERNPIALIQEGANDKSAVVRRVALSGVIELGLYKSIDHEFIQRCTKDASRSVRSRADFIQKKARETA
ncbi:hypothetical protein [Aurantiacibacter aquimixticola]|uniref:hypothetical protein n=1 Tax=Aurantiacibacter aquimixticola TaxID=1958945 RepID=UPI00105893C2|nr:hypothetical protein [Aurantiacibacter aquimixticola]